MPIETDPTPVAAPSVATFPVVGIGASAGGLAALEGFFSALPTDHDLGMAFVVVQHLAPDHHSILTDLLQRCTRLEVLQVESGMTVQPDCVYIIPPNRDMALLHGCLQLLEPATPRLRRLPIDFFLKSLAQDRREQAIGIVVSGTGSDGTLGVRAIKGEGGMVMVQHPGGAEYDGMPRSAIATGLVDFVLPVAEMPAKLLAYVERALGNAAPVPLRDDSPDEASPEDASPDDASLATIFVLIRAQTGHDFSHYKQSTIVRRIRRRMAVHLLEHLGDYVRLLQNTPTEVEELFRDLLIRVTSFFRDAEAFEVLKHELVQRVLPSKAPGQSLRVWVPGCCTGEEAYSLGILLQEVVAELERPIDIHIFATDIDRVAIDQARRGVYPSGIADEMTPERLARAFEAEPDADRYRVKKGLRDLLIFSEQDVVRDPPFSRLDLISCRNLMIYMGTDLQRQLLGVFYYALNPGGLLLLGTSESVGEHRSLFATVDGQAKLFQRQAGAAGGPLTGRGTAYRSPMSSPSVRAFTLRAPGRRLPLRELTEREVLQHCAAVGVLVNAQGDILFLHGRSGSYLEPAPGESSLNVLAMAREGLRAALTAALREAVDGNKAVRRPGLRVRTNGSFGDVNLTIRTVSAEPAAVPASNLYLVILETPPAAPPTAVPTVATARAAPLGDDPADAGGGHIASLEAELKSQGEYLEISRHDLEVSNEQLKSTNEAFQSLNEELQSTNEEMETSKEELQSVNEELATVNAELQQRVVELSRSNNDLNNLIAGTGVGIIFVDHQLRIQRFTPEAVALINLIPTDIGRPIEQIVVNTLGYGRLVPDIQRVLDTLIPIEVEVHTTRTWHLLRIRPYRTLKNVIEGAVITFTDITELKNGQEGLRRLAAVVRDSRDAIVVQALDGAILAWNPGAERLYGFTEAEALARNIRDLVPLALRDEVLARVKQLGEAASLQPYRSQRIAKDGHLVEIELTATALTNTDRNPYAISTTEREYHG